MGSIKLLDVTLRDGGYLNNFHFDEKEIQHIITSLDQSGIDFIEVGYRNGSMEPNKDIGVTGLCPKTYLQTCKKLMTQAKMVVMAHYKNITVNDVKELKACGTDMIRVCVPKSEHEQAYPIISQIKEAELLCSVNFKNVSHYQDESELSQAIEYLLPLKPDLIYFADSNGAIYPKKVTQFYQSCKKHFSLPFGFHAHENLGLAQTNAIAAMESGADYIDASIAGLGRGLGNLKLEFFVAYLQSLGINQYDLKPLCVASNLLRKTLSHRMILTEYEFKRGILDLSAQQVNQLIQASKTKS